MAFTDAFAGHYAVLAAGQGYAGKGQPARGQKGYRLRNLTGCIIKIDVDGQLQDEVDAYTEATGYLGYPGRQIQEVRLHVDASDPVLPSADYPAANWRALIELVPIDLPYQRVRMIMPSAGTQQINVTGGTLGSISGQVNANVSGSVQLSSGTNTIGSLSGINSPVVLGAGNAAIGTITLGGGNNTIGIVQGSGNFQVINPPGGFMNVARPSSFGNTIAYTTPRTDYLTAITATIAVPAAAGGIAIWAEAGSSVLLFMRHNNPVPPSVGQFPVLYMGTMPAGPSATATDQPLTIALPTGATDIIISLTDNRAAGTHYLGYSWLYEVAEVQTIPGLVPTSNFTNVQGAAFTDANIGAAVSTPQAIWNLDATCTLQIGAGAAAGAGLSGVIALALKGVTSGKKVYLGQMSASAIQGVASGTIYAAMQLNKTWPFGLPIAAQLSDSTVQLIQSYGVVNAVAGAPVVSVNWS